MNEIAFMKTLGYHPHVVNLIGCVTSLYDPLLIVEYCAYGDMLSKFSSWNTFLTHTILNFIELLRKHREDLIPSEEGKKPDDPPEFVLAMRELLSFAWQISDGLVWHIKFLCKFWIFLGLSKFAKFHTPWCCSQKCFIDKKDGGKS